MPRNGEQHQLRSVNEQVFRFLAGAWSVRRHFEGSYEGAFSGRADFTKLEGEASAYRYTEQGELTDHEGRRFDAKQSYLYRFERDAIQVLKREGSDWTPMHELEFRMEGSLATASHGHLCGCDDYDVTYRIDLSGSWELIYSVNGPNKDYRIRTVYVR